MLGKEELKTVISKQKTILKEKMKEEGDIDLTEVRKCKKNLKRSQRKLRSILAIEEREKVKKDKKKKEAEQTA